MFESNNPIIDVATLCLEITISMALWTHVRALYRDKVARGVSVIPVFVGIVTNIWYISLFTYFGLPLAALGVVPGMMANITWLILYRRYRQ